MAKKARRKLSSKLSRIHNSHFRRKVVFIISLLLILFMMYTVQRSVQISSAVGEKGQLSNAEADAHQGGNAYGKKGRVCKPAGGAFSFFSLCKVGSTGKGNSCSEGCTCTPFFKKGKWGVCKTSDAPPPVPCDPKTKPPKGNKGDKGEVEVETENDVMMHGGNGGGKPCNPNPTTPPGGGNPTSTPVPGGPTSTPVPQVTGTQACGTECTMDSQCASGFCNPAGFPICPTSQPGQPIEDCQFMPPDPTLPSVCAPAACRANNTDANACACPTQPNNFIYQPKNQ